MQPKYRPWTDRSGTFSPFKATVFAALFLPALWLAWRAQLQELGPRPLNAALHSTGNWAAWILMASLAVTPLRQLLRWGRVLLVRRMVGVAAFAYVALHLVLYVVDLKFSLVKVASEILLRFYLTIGFLGFLALAALAATSFDAAIRRLGGRAWQRLHRLTYAVGVLTLAHFALQTKSDVYEATLCAGCFLWLMGYRLVAPRGGAPSRLAMLALAIGAMLATAATEFGWYGLATGVNPWRVLEANLDVEYGLRPALWVGVLGLGLAALRLLPARRTPSRARAPAQALSEG